MKFNIITIFPNILNSYKNEGMIKKAIERKIISINPINLRDFTTDKHKTVDDTPYGGGAGMLLKVEPIYKAIRSVQKKNNLKTKKIILLSANGQKWNQQKANEYSKLKEITFVCGRYEGVDNRVKEFIDEEISIGDYVLTGGELPAMIIIDSISRLLPEMLGNPNSSIDESHSEKGQGEYPQYTKPSLFSVGKNKYKVPKVLLSGNHKEIEKWKKENIKKMS